MKTLNDIREKATSLGFVAEDPATFSQPGFYMGVPLALYVATGTSMQDGYDYAGFDSDGGLIAVGNESGGPGGFTYGGWLWIKDQFDEDGIPDTKLSKLWE